MGEMKATANTNTRSLKYGLRAYYLTHADVAAQRRAEGRNKAPRSGGDQLELEESQ
jgi:hypothetical protein